MAIKITEYVWEHSGQEGSALLLLLAIADNANFDTWEAWPSVETLARRARVSPRQAKRMIHKLAEDGEIEIRYREGPRMCNVYRIKGSDTHDTMSPMTPCHPVSKVVTSTVGVVTSTVKGGDIAMSPKPSRTVKEPSKNRHDELRDAQTTDPPPSKKIQQEVDETAIGDEVLIDACFTTTPNRKALERIIKRFQEKRPDLDILTEVAKMREWLDHPKRKGTRAMSLAFLDSWLKKEEIHRNEEPTNGENSDGKTTRSGHASQNSGVFHKNIGGNPQPGTEEWYAANFPADRDVS